MGNGTKMQFRLFARRDEGATIHDVAVKDGKMMVTDGRILMECPYGGEDDINEKWPLKIAREYLADVDKVEKWWIPSESDLKQLGPAFEARLRSEIEDARTSYRGRYEEMVCPHCGETVWRDSYDDNKLLSELPDPEEVTPFDVTLETDVVMGGEKILVDFKYLYLLRREFGDDIRISFLKSERDNTDLVAFRIADIKGILMPMRRNMPNAKIPNVLHTTEAS